MTLDETLKRLGCVGAYVEGEWFRPGRIADHFSCQLQEAQAMCRDAYKAGYLKRKTRKVGGRAGTSKIYYRKAVTCPEAYGPWRAKTNADVGIAPRPQIGRYFPPVLGGPVLIGAEA